MLGVFSFWLAGFEIGTHCASLAGLELSEITCFCHLCAVGKSMHCDTLQVQGHVRHILLTGVYRTADDGVPSSNGYVYNIAPALQAQGISKKGEQKDCQSQRTRRSAVRVSSEYDREAHDSSVIWLFKQDLNNE